MPTGRDSLLAGRRAAPLEANDVRRIVTIFRGLDDRVDAVHEPGKKTCFRVVTDENTHETYGQIVFGADIYPGNGVDANSCLSVTAAAAHELAHLYRWADKREIEELALAEIDEAMTSLEAMLRFPKELTDHDRRVLVSDALQRLQRFVAEFSPKAT